MQFTKDYPIPSGIAALSLARGLEKDIDPLEEDYTSSIDFSEYVPTSPNPYLYAKEGGIINYAKGDKVNLKELGFKSKRGEPILDVGTVASGKHDTKKSIEKLLEKYGLKYPKSKDKSKDKNKGKKLVKAAVGGIMEEGRLMEGKGDGVSDEIKANIDGVQEARLSDGEFVIPARIVSEIGNGSTDAGADQLYAMIARIQKNREETIGKDNVAVDTDSEKELPV